MTAAQPLERLAAPRPNPMVVIQRRAFALDGPGPKLQLVVAAAGPIALALLCWERVPPIVFAAAVLIPCPVLMVGLALRLRDRWPSQDVLSWLDESVRADWPTQDLGKQPRNPAEARTWLAAHAEGTAPPYWRATMLIVAGRLDETRATIAGLPTATPRDRSRRQDLELLANAYEGRPIDTAAADAAISSDPEMSQLRIAVSLAYHAALRSTAEGGDGLSQLAAVRPEIGRLSNSVRRRLALVRLRFAIISALIGVWVLVSVLVALASSSGLVWF